MNTIINIKRGILIGGFFLLLISCTQVKTDIEPIVKTTLRGSTEQPLLETKTYFGGKDSETGITPILWSYGDAISLFNGTNVANNLFPLIEGAGTSNGLFDGGIKAVNTYYAFYPYSSAVSITHTSGKPVISFTLPLIQSYKENNIVDGVNPAVAYTTSGGDLEFKNLCGLIKLDLKVSEGIKKIRSIVLISEKSKLSGAATVAMNYGSGAPEIVMVASSNDGVMLDLGVEGVELTTSPKSFYIVVPPFSVSSDNKLTVIINNNMEGKEMLKTTTHIQNIGRSRRLNMPELECETFTVPTYIDNSVNYGKGIPVDLGGTLGVKYFAPVNCGYEAASGETKGYPYGKLYQWGRKYGQGYSTDASGAPTNVSGLTSAVNANLPVNANKFYTAYDSPYDWCNNPTVQGDKDKLWNSGTDASPVNTAYDPCPSGWRVPTDAEWTAFQNLSGGSWTTNETHGSTSGLNGWSKAGLFFPAAGRRDRDGSEYGRGYSSSYWSSGVDGALARYWYFYSGDSFMTNYFRATGYSVRCVKI